eukprot:scaffold133288_cov78-Phaeocystis_antarctica.AAC.1
MKEPAVKTSWSCEQAAPLHGRKMHTTDDFCSHGANLCMQVVAFVNLLTEYGQPVACVQDPRARCVVHFCAAGAGGA